LGELQHGAYDDECEGLNEEEINAFYGFENNGEMHDLDESSDQSDADKDEDDSDGNLEEFEMDEEWIESEDDVINFTFIKSLT
jgi:hypothetical protein